MFDFIQLKCPDVNELDCYPFKNNIPYTNKDNYQKVKNPKREYDLGYIKFIYRYNSKSGKTSETIELSLHKFFSKTKYGKAINWNRFYQSDLQKVITRLKSYITHDYYISILEVGPNIYTTSFKPKHLIKNLIVHYKGKEHSSLKWGGAAREYKLDTYILKIYDKGLKENRNTNILRIETRLTRKALLNPHKICMLDDLLDLKKVNSVFKWFKARINELVIVDSINLPKYANAIDVRNFNDYINPKKVQDRKEKFSDQTAFRDKQRFLSILEKYELGKFKSEIAEKIDSEIEIYFNSKHKSEEFQCFGKILIFRNSLDKVDFEFSIEIRVVSSFKVKSLALCLIRGPPILSRFCNSKRR